MESVVLLQSLLMDLFWTRETCISFMSWQPHPPLSHPPQRNQIGVVARRAATAHIPGLWPVWALNANPYIGRMSTASSVQPVINTAFEAGVYCALASEGICESGRAGKRVLHLRGAACSQMQTRLIIVATQRCGVSNIRRLVAVLDGLPCLSQ